MLGYTSRWMRSSSSSRRCSAPASAQAPGSAQAALTPWLRSPVPFSWGRRAGLRSSSTPRPAAHNARAVGSPPVAPHGVPLSTRRRWGRPQRAKARRRLACTAAAATVAQAPGGYDRRPEDGAGVLVDQPQPAALAVEQADVLLGVHLPDLVGLAGPAVRRRGPAWAPARA